MGHARLILAAGLAVAALALVLPGLNTHGFWFDEAYTARLAALDWTRLLAGAAQDIHPPGWPILAKIFGTLPLPAEAALRLPSAVCFAVLVGLIATRNPVAGGALLFYTPLVEQATQARPYAALAFGLVGIVRLIQGRFWLAAGVATGLVASLHALAGPLAALVALGAAFEERPTRTDAIRYFLPAVALTAWWLPAFLASARRYVDAPWYGPSSAADWWIVADAGGAAIAALLVAGVLVRRSPTRTLPAVLAAALLVSLDAAGFGVEVRKTGLGILPLLLACLPADLLGRTVALVCAALLLLRSAEIPERPDLRQARTATGFLPTEVPVVSVFASEAAWYFRTPAPLPSFREPDAIGRRLAEAIRAQGSECAVSIALPGTFPDALPSALDTIQQARVRGLDVRLVGTAECDVRAAGPEWHAP